MECPPPPPPWRPAVERGTPSNVTLEEMLKVLNMTSRHHHPPQLRVHEAEQHQHSPKGRTETKHKQLVTPTGEDWVAVPQGIMSLAEMLTAA
eukprot:10689588-Karenia_brevis.AAC.1